VNPLHFKILGTPMLESWPAALINTQTVKKSKAPIMTSEVHTGCQSQVHIPVHSYADTVFIFKNTRRSKHFMARFSLRQHKSPQAAKALSTYAWEAGAEMKYTLPMVPVVFLFLPEQKTIVSHNVSRLL